MTDERLRRLEREYGIESGDLETVGRLIAEQERSGSGRFVELKRVFAELAGWTLPSLRPDMLHACGCLLYDLGVAQGDRLERLHEVLNRVLLERLASGFAEPVELQAPGPLGGPCLDRTAAPDEEDFTDLEAFAAAETDYWERYSKPDPWRELVLPVRRDDDEERHATVLAPLSLRAHVLAECKFSLSETLVGGFHDADGNLVQLFRYDESIDQPGCERVIRQQRAAAEPFVAKLFEGLSDAARLFYTEHTLSETSAEARGWSLCRDRVLALVDLDHVRMLWLFQDRYYG